MRTLVHAAGAVLALSMLASCDAGDAQPSSSHPAAASAASSGAAPSGQSSPVPAPCAVETQPRWLLTPGDTWPMAELDAMSQNAFQLDEACDGGPEWPESCDLFSDFLGTGWPGYRTEGAYYIAGINLLNTSGKVIEERILLFGTPSSEGLHLLTDQAKKCGAKVRSSAGKTAIHQFPAQDDRQRYLIVQGPVAVQLTVPDAATAPEVIEKALRRAAEAG